MVGPAKDQEPPELWVPPDGMTELENLGGRLGQPDMFARTFRLREYVEHEPFRAAGLELFALKLPHYTLQTFGFRVTNGARSLAYSGDSGPSERLAELARGCDLFICEATLERAELDGEPRGHLTAEEAVAAFESSGARRLLLTHRPHELPLDGTLELAYDGLQLDLD
jgi:ribonuclease BN (tRNA processing enzyme)